MRASRFVSLVSIGVFLTACAPTATRNPTASGSTMSFSRASVSADAQTSDVQYGTQSGTTLTGFLAVPGTPGPHPAVVLIHEWWGLNRNMKDNAVKYANMGYVALAVDLYGGKVATTQNEAGKFAGAVRANTEPAMDNLKQAVAFLKTRGDVDDARLASVGWCFGGGWSYQMAKNDLGVRATVMYYGQFDLHDDFAHMKADILGHFGEKDMSIKTDDVRQFEVALTKAGRTHEIYIYPNAGHGFDNPDNPAAYNAEAAKTADERTEAFLTKALR